MFISKEARNVADRLLAAFRDPALLPESCAKVFIRQLSECPPIPADSWSLRNRILIALAGTDDARGFKQWHAADRHVKKGARAVYILAPCTLRKKGETDDDDRTIVTGFRAVPVFRVQDTDGAELPAPVYSFNPETLPLYSVAESWGIRVKAFQTADGKRDGYFAYAGMIGLGVENLNVWLHELMHAADHRLGNLKERGQHFRSETVAEFGACILAHLIGRPDAADMGGTYQYLESYAKAAEVPVIRACMDVLDRTCQAIEAILTAAGVEAVCEQSAETIV